MAWLDFLRRPKAPEPPETGEIPIFPLDTVLFPGGILGLKVFETRYLDMASQCLRDGSGFGICLIADGKEVAGPATPHPLGTVAHILKADMEQAGILLLSVQGGRRFRLGTMQLQADGLLRAQVDYLPRAERLPYPPERRRLLPLLMTVIADGGEERFPEPHDFEDAEWVGYRLTEILPIQNLAKQKILELENPADRLEIIERYLDQKKLLG